MTRPGEEEAIRAVRAAAFPADEATNAVATAYPFIADERDAEIERLRAALRRRNEAPSDEQLAIFVGRASRQRGSRPWRIVGYLARCLQDERDRAADASGP